MKNMTKPVIEALATAVFVTDDKGQLKICNSSFKQLFDFEPEPNTERRYGNITFYHPDERFMARAETPVARFLEKRESSGSENGNLVIAERPDGKRLWLRIISSSLKGDQGERIGAIHMLVDVTDQHWEELKKK